jgi:hypothetical protein
MKRIAWVVGLLAVDSTAVGRPHLSFRMGRPPSHGLALSASGGVFLFLVRSMTSFFESKTPSI